MKSYSELQKKVEDIVYNFITQISKEVSSYDLGLHSMAADPIYITGDVIIIAKIQEERFLKYTRFSNLNKEYRNEIDGYVFYRVNPTDNNCLVFKALKYYWDNKAVQRLVKDKSM